MSMFEIHGGFTGLAASSRVRLARNIKGYPFRLTEQQHSEIADKIFAALKANPTIGPEFDKKQIIPRSTEASQLVEEHLISPELAQNGGWLIVSKDSGVSIMVGEEDHLRLQVIGTGLCPKECLETANRVASLIEAALPFAYDERLGYLTACPTNIGTGLRASIMLHLPMLTATKQMDRIIGYAGSRGCAVRGTYGEGSQAVGGFYQVSNQVTLGASAAELTDKLVETATTIIDAEKKSARAGTQPERTCPARPHLPCGRHDEERVPHRHERSRTVHFRCADRSADGFPVRHGRAKAVRTGGAHPSGNADRRTAGPR